MAGAHRNKCCGRSDLRSVLGGTVEDHSAILLEFSSVATRSCDRFLRIKSVTRQQLAAFKLYKQNVPSVLVLSTHHYFLLLKVSTVSIATYR